MITSLLDKFKRILPRKRLKDPVCGMEATEGINFEYKGVTYSFCSGHCREQFEGDPEQFIAKK